MLLDEEYALDCRDKKMIISYENHNKHILINDVDAVVYQYRIDGNKAGKDTPKPVFSSGTKGERCDFVVEVIQENQKSRLYIIELKGSDLMKAISQIEKTIATFKENKKLFKGFNIKNYELYPRVVIHRFNTHSITTSYRRNLQSKLPNFVVKCKTLEENISKPAKWQKSI